MLPGERDDANDAGRLGCRAGEPAKEVRDGGLETGRMDRRPAPTLEAKVRVGRVRSWLCTAGTFRVKEREGLVERFRGVLLTRTQFAFRAPSPWTRWTFLAGRGGVEWAWVVICSGMKFSSGK